MADTRRTAPLARDAMAYVLAGGRGSRLMELTDRRAKPAVFFGGKSRIIDFALSNALNSGIRRFGEAHAPLDESLVRCVVDYGRRPHVVYAMELLRGRINEFDVEILSEFVKGYAQAAGATIHMDAIRGENPHHIAEAAFKALGLATRDAFRVIGGGVPSTKGTL